MQPQIKYVERKVDGLRGVGRITRVSFSRSGRTVFVGDRVLCPIGGDALKANYRDQHSAEEFWVSNPRRDGADSLFPSLIEIDSDVREEYWTQVRRQPEQSKTASYRSPGKSKRERERLERAVRRHDMDRRFRAPRADA